MLNYRNDDRVFHIRHSSWMAPALLLIIPPVLIYELGPGLLDGSLDRGDTVGFIIGVFGPLIAIYFIFELSEFSFTLDDNLFRWRRRDLVRREQGEVPLSRILRVRRDALHNTNSTGRKYSYRLVVILDDDTMIPLSRGYSAIHDRLLDRIVKELRNFLGHVERMP